MNWVFSCILVFGRLWAEDWSGSGKQQNTDYKPLEVAGWIFLALSSLFKYFSSLPWLYLSFKSILRTGIVVCMAMLGTRFLSNKSSTVHFAHSSPGQARASAGSDAGALLMRHPVNQEPRILLFPHQPPFPLLSSLWADILWKSSRESEVVLFSSSVFADWVTNSGPVMRPLMRCSVPPLSLGTTILGASACSSAPSSMLAPSGLTELHFSGAGGAVSLLWVFIKSHALSFSFGAEQNSKSELTALTWPYFRHYKKLNSFYNINNQC